MDIQETQIFSESLRQLYRERNIVSEEQWPPGRGEKLINLQLVETEKHEGFQGENKADKVKYTPIELKDLFSVAEGRNPVRKVLLEGNAGIGKTTLCRILAEGWAKGEILTQFDNVLYLPLRDECISSASSILDLLKFFHSSELICSTVQNSLERSNGKGVLIIADGWDELEESKRAKTSFIYQLMFGQHLRLASVLLTSRPSASADLHKLPSLHRVVEILGFNEERIKQYITAEFETCPTKASSLIEQLEYNPLIQSVCSVPLNCAIVCNLWHTQEEILPETLTELYTQLILCIMLRNLKKVPKHSIGLSLTSFDSIPQALQENFWLICKFAYHCLVHDKIIFSEAELHSFFPEGMNHFLCFGLLQTSQSPLPVGHSLSFHFLHLTIHEFLTALHFSTLSSSEKQISCKKYAKKIRFAMMWRFVFGLACVNPPAKKSSSETASKGVIALDATLVDLFLSEVVTTKKPMLNIPMFSSIGDPEDQPLLLCHCALESKDTTIREKVAQVDNRLFANKAHTPFDYAAVNKILQHSTQTEVNIGFGGCGLEDRHLNGLAHTLSTKAQTMRVHCLILPQIDRVWHL